MRQSDKQTWKAFIELYKFRYEDSSTGIVVHLDESLDSLGDLQINFDSRDRFDGCEWRENT